MILPGPGPKDLIVKFWLCSREIVSRAAWIEFPVASLILSTALGSLYYTHIW